MLLDDLLERNRGFVRGRESRPLPDPDAIRTAFIACYDPRLDPILRPALGLAPTEGIVLRTAGALVGPVGDPLRSLALAVFLFNVQEVYVVAHTSCRMKSLATAPFIDAFRARGVARESFGPQDLREWAGAFSDLELAVEGSLRTIALAPIIPADLLVAGLLLDDATGALEVVAAPATVATLRAAPGVVQTAPLQRIASPHPESLAAIPATAPELAEAPQSVQATSPGLSKEVEAIRGFVRALETTSGWREDLARLRKELERQNGSVARLTLVEKFVRRTAANAHGISSAFEQLKKESASARASLGPEDLVDLFRRMGKTG